MSPHQYPHALCMWAIYRPGTDGYPGFTARMWQVTSDGARPTDHILRTPDIDRLRTLIGNADKVCFLREETDPAELVETWL